MADDDDADYTSDVKQVEYLFSGWFTSDVVGTEVIVQGKKKVTFYVIKTSIGTQTYSVKRRFSSWLELHNQLVDRGKKLPPFPGKTLTKDLKEEKKLVRQKKLQAFLKGILDDKELATSPEILAFLELNAALQMGSKPVDLSVYMTCMGCAAKVKNVLQKVPGIQQVAIDLDKKQVSVRGLRTANEILDEVCKTGLKTSLMEASN